MIAVRTTQHAALDMQEILPFEGNPAPSLGVELELMLVDPATWDLTTSAPSITRIAGALGLGQHIKLEITQSMIEIDSSVHAGYAALTQELHELGCALVGSAARHDTRVCGGGTHPFHRWQERRISPTSRFHELAHRYGYLAKQFTVFGQHIHVGCADGDTAVRTIQVLGRFVPHFIALAAGSPFHRGADTAFDSCRLNMIAAFPLSGRMPPLVSWSAFERFYARLRRIGVVASLKDLYWDIRPKPEFGTIELRVPDTPLEIDLAGDLAAYAQVLVSAAPQLELPEWLDDFVYRHNRFQAARFGFEGRLIVGERGEHASVREDILRTIEGLVDVGARLRCQPPLARLAARAAAAENGAAWLRRAYGECGEDFRRLVERTADRWLAGGAPASG
jgi:carboxylate-amine ligase